MSNEWKQRPEGGSALSIRMIRGIGRYGGRGLARLFLFPITAYFVLRRPGERRGSRDYLTRVLGRPASLGDVARHIHTFASTILDRVFLLSEDTRRFAVDIRGVDRVHAQLDKGRGALLFGSHLGSFEVLRVLARRRPEYTIRVVLDKGHNPTMTQLLDALNPQIASTVIDASQDGPTLMLAIKEAADQGALIALLVDRTQPGDAAVAVDFFGEPALFPTAPWLLASVLKVPVCLAFGLYHGGNRYSLEFEEFSDGIHIPRQQRAAGIAALIQRYATRLEHYTRQAPYNWFNFYDFWDSHSERIDSEGINSAGSNDQPGAAPATAPAAVVGSGVDETAVDATAGDRTDHDDAARQQHGFRRG